MVLQRTDAPLQEDVVDCEAANDIPVLRSGVDIVLIRKAVQMFKQSFVILGQDRFGAKCLVSRFVIVEDAHSETPNDTLQPTAGQRSTELWAPPAASSATNRRIPRTEGGSAASPC